jgi:hypothetical protein
MFSMVKRNLVADRRCAPPPPDYGNTRARCGPRCRMAVNRESLRGIRAMRNNEWAYRQDRSP